MVKNLLTPKDVCEIINKCGEAGVSELKFSNLYVSFGSQKKLAKESSAQSQVTELDQQQKIEVQEAKAVEEAELIHKQDELANLHIDDPSAFEDGLANGDFIDMLGDKDADA
jgi:hypothetical protein